MTDAAPRVETISLGDRTVHLLGTAHVSAQSCAEVEAAVRTLRPDVVLVELDPGRLQALRDPEAWRRTDIRKVLRERQLPALIAGLVLSSYQRRLGGQTGVRPGAELLRAVTVAEAEGIRVELCDRPIKTTLRRIWRAIPFWRKPLLLMGLFGSLFSREKISEQDLGALRQGETLDLMLKEMGSTLPQLATSLVSERDWYMSERLQASTGRVALAVVGAAHVPGMAEALRAGRRFDLAALDAVPQPALAYRLAWWSISALVIAALVALIVWKWHSNPGEAFKAIRLWILCTSGPAVLAAIIALAHPLVILLIAVAAPFAALLRAIPGPKLSLLSALLQAWLVPPRVEDLEDVADSMHRPAAWWRNRVLRLFLVFTLPGLAATAGAVWALTLIARGG